MSKLINKSYKFRLYPNKEQEEVINKSIGSCRFIYNNFLDIRIKEYEYYSNSSNYVKDASELKDLKQEFEYAWYLYPHPCLPESFEYPWQNYLLFEHQ